MTEREISAKGNEQTMENILEQTSHLNMKLRSLEKVLSRAVTWRLRLEQVMQNIK